MKKVLFAIGLLAAVTLSAADSALPKGNLIVNGDFSKVDANGRISGWERQKNAAVEKIDNKPTLVLTGSYAAIAQSVKLEPFWGTLHLTMKMKAEGVEVGDANWKDGRLAMSFNGADGKRVGNWPKVFNAKGTTDWIPCSYDYEIPYGAVTVELSPANFGKAGKMEFQDIKLTVTEMRNNDPNAKPIIILKLDDVTKVTKNWQQCADFLKEENVKASFGIIGNALEKDDPQLVKWIKDLHASGRVEFWNHGYKNRTNADKIGEFESDSTEEQLKSLKRTQELVKEKMGITLAAFGPHWSGTNQQTIEALKGVPEIKSVFYYTASPDGSWFVFKRYLDMEQPTFCPNPEAFIKGYESGANKKPYLAMQGHPNSWWKPERFENFKKIVRFLKEKGCKFMTVSEYLESVKKTK